MKTIELSYETVDQIVVDELKDSLERCTILDRDEGGSYTEPDHDLIKSLKRVLGFFMVPSEYQEYMRDFALTEMVMYNQYMGLYEEHDDTAKERKGP